jgi:hypothetical protein
MTVNMKIDLTKFKNKVRSLTDLRNDAMPLLYDEFVKLTPRKTGNARSNTTHHSNIINANYAYADVLDQGRGYRDGQMRGSEQAPDGMSRPLREYAKQLLPQIAKRLGAK